MTKNVNFLEQVKNAKVTVVKRGGGGRTGSHASAYISKQGRLFNATDEHDTYFDVKRGELEDGTVFISLTKAEPVIVKDKDGIEHEEYGKALKSSTKATGAPFITVTRLCKELFGDDKENWEADFEDQGVDENGTQYYTLVKTEKENAKDN